MASTPVIFTSDSSRLVGRRQCDGRDAGDHQHDAGRAGSASAVRRTTEREDERHRGELRHEDGADRDGIASPDRERREPGDLRITPARTSEPGRAARRRQASREGASGSATPSTPITRAGTRTQTTGTASPTLPVANRLQAEQRSLPRQPAAQRGGSTGASRSPHLTRLDRGQNDADDDDREGQRDGAESGSPARTAKHRGHRALRGRDRRHDADLAVPGAQRTRAGGRRRCRCRRGPARRCRGERDRQAEAGGRHHDRGPTSMTQPRTTNG